MGLIVQKYGGSSVADVAKLRAVAEQVAGRRRGGDDIVVVVSAMGKTTDELLAIARQVAQAPARRELDMLVTAGERIAMALLSMAIHEAGCEAISFTGSQSGIITEDSHQGARIMEVRPQRILPELERGRIVIVAGYQGVSWTTKEVTTLGRGGSDTTAVALAAALQADACEIYSDVDGVYSADPRVCAQARHLPELSYEVMQTMAGVGAKVLNVQAVEFARRASITIHARQTGAGEQRETLVRAKAPRSAQGVVAVVGSRRAACVRCDTPGSCAGAITRLQALGARVIAIAGPDVWIDTTDGDEAALAHAAAEQGNRLDCVGLVSLVGSECLRQADMLQFEQSPCVFAHDGHVAFRVPRAVVDDAVRLLHKRWVEGGAEVQV